MEIPISSGPGSPARTFLSPPRRFPPSYPINRGCFRYMDSSNTYTILPIRSPCFSSPIPHRRTVPGAVRDQHQVFHRRRVHGAQQAAPEVAHAIKDVGACLTSSESHEGVVTGSLRRPLALSAPAAARFLVAFFGCVGVCRVLGCCRKLSSGLEVQGLGELFYTGCDLR